LAIAPETGKKGAWTPSTIVRAVFAPFNAASAMGAMRLVNEKPSLDRYKAPHMKFVGQPAQSTQRPSLVRVSQNGYFKNQKQARARTGPAPAREANGYRPPSGHLAEERA
jgi:hypothetical protein